MFAVGFKALPFYAGAAKMSNITPGARADPTKARTLSSLFSAKVRKIRMNPFKIKGSRTEGSRERIKKRSGDNKILFHKTGIQNITSPSLLS
jgi:hypothetical protein